MCLLLKGTFVVILGPKMSLLISSYEEQLFLE